MLLSGLFAFYLSLYFLRLHEYRPETADTNILFVTLSLCLIVYIFYRKKNFKVLQVPYLIGFFVWSVLSHVSFGYLAGAISTADDLLRLMVLYFISAALFVDRKRLNFYFAFICLCALFLALHGVDQYFNEVGWSGQRMFRGRIRYLGVFRDPNDLGMVFAISIPFFFHVITNSKSYFLKTVWLSGLSVVMYAIYLTNSRGTMLAVLLMLVLYGWKKLSRTLLFLGLSVALPALFAVTRLSTIESGDASARGRIDAWTQGFYMLRSDPLFGVGYGLFRDHHELVAHSSFVQRFAETGIIGYFFWLGFLSMSIYALYKFVYSFQVPERFEADIEVARIKKQANTVIYSLVAFAAAAFFISRSTQPILFILCGMSAGVLTQIQHKFNGEYSFTFRQSIKPCIFATIVSVLVIYIVIRLFW